MNAMNHRLAKGLLQAVRAQDFGETADSMRGGAAVAQFPSLDLAVVSFAAGRAPQFANVLFSREHPAGHVAAIDAQAGALQGLRFDADVQDAQGRSAAWLPGADWSRMTFAPLSPLSAGHPGPRFVAPYPASLLKLMVAVGVALAFDEDLCEWPEALEPMMVVSSNEATDECVALLHRVGWLAPASDHRLNRCFLSLDMHTLQLNHTTARGGWRNGDGAGVGHIHMTAWDTVRLLWWLDPEAPPAPWLQSCRAVALKPTTRRRLMDVLARQQLNEILSSGGLRGEPGWVRGLPDSPVFAHKTGTTQNYASDAGRVWAPVVAGAATTTATAPHYLVAVLTNLGDRYAPTPQCATTWRLPALGAALHQLMESRA